MLDPPEYSPDLFAGRVGTGFSEKLLKALSLELNKIAVKSCPFLNLPATGRGLDPGLTVERERGHPGEGKLGNLSRLSPCAAPFEYPMGLHKARCDTTQ